jgi:hypothetical protein
MIQRNHYIDHCTMGLITMLMRSYETISPRHLIKNKEHQTTNVSRIQSPSQEFHCITKSHNQSKNV